mgnify:FL=1
MAITKFSRNYHEKMFPKYHSAFLETDPEFIERFDNFAFDEVVNSDDLDDKTRFIAILASLLGCQGVDEFSVMLGAAMNFGVTPVEIREIVYQATAYLGIGRVFPFLKVMNKVFTEKGIKLPLEIKPLQQLKIAVKKEQRHRLKFLARVCVTFGSPDRKKADI